MIFFGKEGTSVTSKKRLLPLGFIALVLAIALFNIVRNLMGG